jgi:hypothetical protein
MVIPAKRPKPIEKPRRGKRKKVAIMIMSSLNPSLVRGFKKAPTFSCFLKILKMRTLAKPVIQIPTHRGKNPGPGPYSE